MSRFFRISTLTVLAGLALGAATPARAAFMGTLGVIDTNTKVDGNSLGTATSFTLGGMFTNGNTSGGFVGTPVLSPFGSGTFTLTGTPALTVGSAALGFFTETAAPIQTASSVVNGVTVGRTFYILGNFTPTAAQGDGPPVAASFTFSFTQDGGPNTAVSASGSLSIPPTGTVPEPASVTLLGLGVTGLALVARRRRPA